MEEKILKELKDINVQLKGFDQRFEGIDQRFQETEEKIITTLREEITAAEKRIKTEISDEIKDLCDSIQRVKNKDHKELKEDLRRHERNSLKGIEALKKALVS